ALTKSEPKYRQYRLMRDFAEFDAAGHDPAWVTDGRSFVIMAFVRFNQATIPEAVAEYEALVEANGENRVRDLGEKLRRSPRKDGRLQNLESLGLAKQVVPVPNDAAAVQRSNGIIPAGYTLTPSDDSLRALLRLLGSDNPRQYLKNLIRDRDSAMPLSGA